ncbi:MAG: tRNA pseudouridine(55) synthase TruB [Flavobacteriaceae bacterium]
MEIGLKSRDDFLDGQILLIDKPLEWTSFDAVNSIKWAIKRRFGLRKIKVGHAGTLDPLASGLLVICTGRATKKIQEIQSSQKEYEGVITLGATTPSYDMETEVGQHFSTEGIDDVKIRAMTAHFTGKISQIPPVFSAIKKDGKRLYEYARSGKDVDVKAREVEIMQFDILSVKIPEVGFRICCSKGTYIRSIAHDFGQKLGCGGYLSSLRRTRIGDFNVNNALHPKKFGEELKAGGE